MASPTPGFEWCAMPFARAIARGGMLGELRRISEWRCASEDVPTRPVSVIFGLPELSLRQSRFLEVKLVLDPPQRVS